MKRRHLIILAIVSLAALLADRLTKFIVIKKLSESSGVFIFEKPWLTVSFVKSINNKLAFSLPLSQFLIIVLTSLIIGVLIWLLIKKIRAGAFVYSLFLLTICLSAIGNLFDRIYYGGVIDFISLKFFNFNWAIFNLADVFITAGVIGLLILEIKKPKAEL
jgi:signal peptidase II